MVLDLTAGHGEVAKACLINRIPYLGICMTEQHQISLKTRLTNWLKQQMVSETSKFYNPMWLEAAGLKKPKPNEADMGDGKDTKTQMAKERKRKEYASDDGDDDGAKKKKSRRPKKTEPPSSSDSDSVSG